MLDAQAEAAQLAASARHAELKRSLERGHTDRLWLAAPLVIWSFMGMGALVLVVAVAGLHLMGQVEDFACSAAASSASAWRRGCSRSP